MEINGIDKLDEMILELLEKDGRMSYSDIGECVGLSRTAVKNRISELEKNGVIKGYKAVVNHNNRAPMTFITTVETEPAAFDEVAEAMKNEKCVVTLCQISGECALHAVCVAKNTEEMRNVAKRIRNSNPKIKRFYASGVWEVMKGSVLPE